MGKFSKFSADDYFGDDDNDDTEREEQDSDVLHAIGIDDPTPPLTNFPVIPTQVTALPSFTPPPPPAPVVSNLPEPVEDNKPTPLVPEHNYGWGTSLSAYRTDGTALRNESINEPTNEPTPFVTGISSGSGRKLPAKALLILVTIFTLIVTFVAINAVSGANEKANKLKSDLSAAKADAASAQTELDRSDATAKTLNAKIDDLNSELKTKDSCLDGYKAFMSDALNRDLASAQTDLENMDTGCLPKQ